MDIACKCIYPAVVLYLTQIYRQVSPYIYMRKNKTGTTKRSHIIYFRSTSVLLYLYTYFTGVALGIEPLNNYANQFQNKNMFSHIQYLLLRTELFLPKPVRSHIITQRTRTTPDTMHTKFNTNSIKCGHNCVNLYGCTINIQWK